MLPAALVAAAAVLPLVYLIVRSAETGRAFWDLLLRPRTLQILFNSAALAAAVTASASLIAVPLAWLLVRTDLPWRRFWDVATALPLAIPTLVGGFTFVAAFGRGGILQELLAKVWERPWIPDIYGFGGAWAVLTLLTYPYVLMPVRAALRSMDPAQEEAARSLGHSSASIFFRVIIPNLRPAVLLGGLLVALYTLSDFAAVSMLQYDSFTRAIYVQFQASFNRHYAAVLSLVLVALTAGLVALEAAAKGRARYHRIGTGVKRKPKLVRLGAGRWPALIFCALLVAFAVGLPLAVTLFWLIRGIVHGEPLLLMWGPALNTLGAGLAAAFLTVAAALPIGFLSVRFRSPITAFLERCTYLGYALPGIVVALSLVFFGARYAGPLYQTIWMLLFAYAVLFLPQALGAIRSTLLQINPRLEDVARSLGQPPLRIFFHVLLPLARGGIVAGGALVFLTVAKELPATLLLSPIGFSTLATSVWSAMNDAFYARAAAPALLMIAVSGLSLFFLLPQEMQRGDAPQRGGGDGSTGGA